MRDLNPRPSVYKTAALPTELIRRAVIWICQHLILPALNKASIPAEQVKKITSDIEDYERPQAALWQAHDYDLLHFLPFHHLKLPLFQLNR